MSEDAGRVDYVAGQVALKLCLKLAQNQNHKQQTETGKFFLKVAWICVGWSELTKQYAFCMPFL